MKASKKSGLFGKIFGWVAASAMLVAAVAATVATGGAAAPLLAAAIFNMTLMVLEETGHMEKLQQWLADKMGSELGATLLITGVIIALNLAAMGGGGLNAAANMQKATTTAQKVAVMIQVGSEVAVGAALVGQGAANTVSAKQANEASQAQADSTELQKFLKKVQAMMEEEMDRLEEAIQQLEGGMSLVMDIMRGNDETHSLITRQMA